MVDGRGQPKGARIGSRQARPQWLGRADTQMWAPLAQRARSHAHAPGAQRARLGLMHTPWCT
eukprot:34296-Chlamydomonas_euryale.AAC.2